MTFDSWVVLGAFIKNCVHEKSYCKGKGIIILLFSHTNKGTLVVGVLLYYL